MTVGKMITAATQLVATLVLAASLTGCAPETRHRLLTFFFTGVPPLEEQKPVEKKNQQQSVTATRTGHRPVSATAVPLFSHPVWAAGVCTPCHETTGVFRTPGVQKTAATAFKTGGGRPGTLARARNQLCTQCHKDKTRQRAVNDQLWLHDTAAKGDCLACHDPHQSPYPRTLRQPPAVLCLPCHRQGAFLQTPAHQKGEACLACHNPHMGSNRNLLTNEYKEIKTPVVLDLETLAPAS